MKRVPVFHKLPERCADRLLTNGAPIIIVRGEEGYYAQKPGFDVAAFNKRNGISSAQIRAMKHGSMFGWNCPAADPDHEANQINE